MNFLESHGFSHKWRGQVLIGVIHVGDILFVPSSESIRVEFLRRLRAEFDITGVEELAQDFCGFQFRYGDDGSITLHQERFERLMLEKYGALGLRPRDTPMISSRAMVWYFHGTTAG